MNNVYSLHGTLLGIFVRLSDAAPVDTPAITAIAYVGLHMCSVGLGHHDESASLYVTPESCV